ncbi:MAG TPA: helix-turn-helix transcriptional regulator [Gaiellaceae bacterium]
METIGERIRRLRTEQGLSLREIAGPGISYAHVSRLEAGSRNPSEDALRLLSRRLGVSQEYLESGRRVRGYVLRERRIADAELDLLFRRNLERAEAIFRAEADPASGFERDEFLTARAEAGLGLLAAQRGSRREAIRRLEAATASGYLHAAKHPDLYWTLGDTYIALGAPAKAIELFERCLAQLDGDAAEDAGLAVRFLAYLALAASSLGDNERVRFAMAEATQRAGEAELPQARIFLYWTIAVSEWKEERSETARHYLKRAIELLESTEDSVRLARARLLYAQMLTLEGSYNEAEPYLAAAAGVEASVEKTDLGLLRAEQAKVAAARGEGAAALTLARDAAELLGDDVRYRGNKWHALAAAQAAVGDIEGASTSYRNGVAVLEERRQWREATVVARESARFLRTTRREAEAWEVLDRLTVLAARRPLGLAHVG